MADVVNVLNTCKPYLIGFGIVLAIALIVLIAAFKLKKTKRKLVRSQAGIAILLALVNMICWGPMSSMISLATGNGTISEETSNEATKLVEKIAEEGIVLLKNEDNMLPMENNTSQVCTAKFPGRFPVPPFLPTYSGCADSIRSILLIPVTTGIPSSSTSL